MQNIFGLEIDEKLTLRFLKVSNTKKTVLINRGSEDGLVVGDHAKFFITEGVVARGVIEKVSPSRSIWSLYRIVAPDEILDNKVMNLKIATPVKITTDSSKSFKENEIESGSEKMSLDEKIIESKSDKMQVEDTKKMNEEDEKELEELGVKKEKNIKESAPKSSSVKVNQIEKESDDFSEMETESYSKMTKTWDVFGTISMNSLSGKVEGESSSSTSGAASVLDISLGLEKYLIDYSQSLKNFSLIGFLQKKSMEVGSGVKISSDWFMYGAGANYHFYNTVERNNRIIGFGTINFGVGTVSNTSKVTSGSVSTETPQNGTMSFFSFGLGAKYNLKNDFGIRGIFDYYSSTETFSYDNGSTSTRSLSGPRLQFGLSYRF